MRHNPGIVKCRDFFEYGSLTCDALALSFLLKEHFAVFKREHWFPAMFESKLFHISCRASRTVDANQVPTHVCICRYRRVDTLCHNDLK